MEELSRREVRELARLTESLTVGQQAFFQATYWRLRRNPTTAFVLCVLLGNFGAHYFYFGRYRGAVLRLLFCWTLIPWLVALYEARSIASRAMRYNASLANELVLAVATAAEARTTNMRAQPSESTRDETSREQRPPVAAAVPEVARTTTPLPRAAHLVEAGMAAAAVASFAPEATGSVKQQAPAPTETADQFAASDEHEDQLIAAAWRGRESGAQEYVEPAAAEEATEPVRDVWSAPVSAIGQTTLLPGRAMTATQPQVPVESVRAGEQISTMALPRTTHPLGEWLPLEGGEAEALALESAAASEPARDDADASVWPSYANDVTTVLRRAPTEWDAGGDRRNDFTDSLPRHEAEREADADPDAEFDTPRHELAAEEQEPVFMYQLGTLARRESVRVAPPTPLPVEEPESEMFKARDLPLASASHTAGTQDIALLGPALASGLADLLRERPARTHPRTTEESALFADAPQYSPLAPLSGPSAGPPQVDESGGAERMERPWSGEWVEPTATPNTLDDDDLPSLVPAVVSQGLQQALNGIRESTSMAPTAAYISTPSRHMRRRVVQRVIVRKMAVLDGRVVAESTVERQVQVVDDEEEMADRIRVATTEAAREALLHLVSQAPEEALPAIRMQLYALDNASSVSNFQGNGVLASPKR